MAKKNHMAKKMYTSYTKFHAQLADWSPISDGAYHQIVAL